VFAPPPVEEDFFQEGAEGVAQPDQLLAHLRTQANTLRHEADRLKAQSTQAKVIPRFLPRFWIRIRILAGQSCPPKKEKGRIFLFDDIFKVCHTNLDLNPDSPKYLVNRYGSVRLFSSCMVIVSIFDTGT
jgi:hypothetical protein